MSLPSHQNAIVPESGFTNSRLLVIGDLMLDRYIVGDVNRISPEAPVPVVSVRGERCTAGGAGNVALNVAGLGAKAFLAGIIGDDAGGQTLLRVLAENRVDTSATIIDASRPTTTKTRIMSGSHQMIRIDEEVTREIPSEMANNLLAQVVTLLDQTISGVLLSDYAKGVLTSSVLSSIIEECLRRKIPVFVDPKRGDYSAYARVTCLTPNLKEFHAAAALMGIPHEDLTKGGRMLRERLGCAMLLITQGAEGMTLITAEQVHHLAALTQDVFDVSGAGDTVVATYATALSAGLEPLAAVELSNMAASIVVRKVGTAPISWRELSPAIKILSGIHPKHES